MRLPSSPIADVAGWRRWLLAAAAGAFSVLAMAPFFVWPVLFATLPVFVWLIDDAVSLGAPSAAAPRVHGFRSRLSAALRTGPGRAAVIGWLFGFGYFVPGLFWIGEAFLVEAEKFAVLLPFAVTLLPAGLGLFWAAAAAAAAWFWQPGLARVVVLAVALSAAEWLRGHVFTGFPWNVLGYSLTWPLPLMQSAAVLGIYGLTLIAVAIFAAPAVVWADAREGRVAGIRRWAGVPMALLPLTLMFAAGQARLAASPTASGANLKVRLVQPSVPQREKWRPENQDRIFTEHIELSRRDGSGAIDEARGVGLIVWPEAAMPFLPLQAPAALAAIGRMLPENTYLLSGALRLEQETTPTGAPRRKVFNSLMVFGEGGRVLAVYDKIHLVPFGEYLPFQRTLEAIGLEQLARLRGGFAVGVTPRPLLQIPGWPALGPLICYEAIFPGEIVQGGTRPRALINLTNDGWFGNTTGPRQHLHQSRVRAVEEGLPVLRAANNGVSAVIDAQGRELARLDLDVKGAVDAVLPPALDPPVYARFHDLPFAGFLLLAAAGLAAASTRRKGL